MYSVKSLLAASLFAASSVSAHSWLECANHDNSELLGWMKGNSTLTPPVIIDPAMPWYAQYCHGWPRAKANPGNWIDESSNYSWNLAANAFNKETHACRPSQRSANYVNGAPMTTAAPGSMIRLRYGGNGHTRGYNVGGSPGTVSVYWKGGPEREITDISEFTEANKLQTSGFADLNFAYPADPAIKTPVQGLVDKGNWMELHLPKDMAPGRHMMVWVWYYNDPSGKTIPQWSTCFDVMIQGGAASSGSAPAAAAPAPAPAAPAPAPAAPAPAAAAPVAPAPAVAAPNGKANSGSPKSNAAVVSESSSGAAQVAAPAPAAPAPADPSPVAPAPTPESTQVNEAPDNDKTPYINWWRRPSEGSHARKFRFF